MTDTDKAPRENKYFIVATAGHVDHGKTSLVRALTGTDTDRLPEEKARQITIDLGFAELAVTADIHAAIVDVPGHEDFISNMIAGVGSVDLALLIVAADDGWMPQTQEHVEILQYLGVTRAVIALTKSDIGDADNIEKQVRSKLQATTWQDASIVRTSLESGSEDLKHAIAAELEQLVPQRDIGKPRLFIDRAFALHGIGTVVTGALSDGSLRVGQNVYAHRGNREARIRSIQSHNRNLDFAGPGRRVALNLPELRAEEDIRRGDIITPEQIEPTPSFVAILTKAPGSYSVALKSGASVYLHHGSGRVTARVFLNQRDELLPGETITAQIRLASPLVAFVGDRFVLRDASQRHTIAGSTVVGLTVGRAAIPVTANIDACAGYEIAGETAMERARVLKYSRFSRDDIEAALVRLEQRHRIVLTSDLAIVADKWIELRTGAIGAIEAAHRAHPERPGISLSDLRAALATFPPKAIDAVIVDLCAHDCVRIDSAIAHRSHQPKLPPELETAAAAIKASLANPASDPPNQRVTTAAMRGAIKYLVSNGEIVEVAPETFLLASAFTEMKNKIIAFISTHQRATVSQLRQALGTSRRIVVPLVEMLDRQGVTRRIGDERVLAQAAREAKLQNGAETRR